MVGTYPVKPFLEVIEHGREFVLWAEPVVDTDHDAWDILGCVARGLVVGVEIAAAEATAVAEDA